MGKKWVWGSIAAIMVLVYPELYFVGGRVTLAKDVDNHVAFFGTLYLAENVAISNRSVHQKEQLSIDPCAGLVGRQPSGFLGRILVVDGFASSYRAGLQGDLLNAIVPIGDGFSVLSHGNRFEVGKEAAFPGRRLPVVAPSDAQISNYVRVSWISGFPPRKIDLGYRQVGADLSMADFPINANCLSGLPQGQQKKNQAEETKYESNSGGSKPPVSPKGHILLGLRIGIGILSCLVGAYFGRKAFSDDIDRRGSDGAFLAYAGGGLLLLTFSVLCFSCR